MININNYEVWFVTGSQHLYGEKTLAQVAENSKTIADAMGLALPIKVIYKPVLTGPDAIATLCREANNSPSCIGLICWMHTFSPAKMWIGGFWQDADVQNELSVWTRVAAGWIFAGGAHHTCFTQEITQQYLEIFAEMAGMECVVIGKDSMVDQIRKELRWNEAYYDRGR